MHARLKGSRSVSPLEGSERGAESHEWPRSEIGSNAGPPREAYPVKYSDAEAGGRERGRPKAPQRGCRVGDPTAGRGAVGRDRCNSASTPGVPAARLLRGVVARWGCSRTGPAFIAVVRERKSNEDASQNRCWT